MQVAGHQRTCTGRWTPDEATAAGIVDAARVVLKRALLPEVPADSPLTHRLHLL